MTETTARSWRIALVYDVLPISLNDRRHHMAVYRVRRGLRDRVRMMTRHLEIPRLDACHVRMEWTPKTNRKRDQDNAVATLKAAIDGLRDYGPQYRDGRIVRDAWTGIVADDTPEFLTWDPPVITEPNKDPWFTERLVLIVTERPAA